MPRLIGLVLVFLLLGITASHAAPDDDQLTRAEARWKQGKAFYDSGQWDQAIAEFRAAWELVREPDLVFGIALALHKKGDHKAALAEARRYLELAPTGSAANEARELVVVLTPKVEALDADAVRRDAEAKRQAEAEAKRRADERAQREHASADERRRARMLRWSGIAGAVVGASLVGLGAKFGLDARDASDELTAHTMDMWTDELLARQAEGRSANRKFIALTAIGSALIIGGGVVYVLGRRAEPRAELLVFDRGAGLGFAGGF
jgi:tetratricopeptide (TPR) repeat protein